MIVKINAAYIPKPNLSIGCCNGNSIFYMT